MLDSYDVCYMVLKKLFLSQVQYLMYKLLGKSLVENKIKKNLKRENLMTIPANFTVVVVTSYFMVILFQMQLFYIVTSVLAYALPSSNSNFFSIVLQ